MARRRRGPALAAAALAAVPWAGPRTASAAQVWVDLNTYVKGREGGDDPAAGAVARTAAFARADGVWLITDNAYGDRNVSPTWSGISSNASTGFTLADWRAMVTAIAGPAAPVSTEDNPTGPHPDAQSYADAAAIAAGTGFTVADAMQYNETGSTAGGTLLSPAQIAAYSADHGGSIAVLTRGYNSAAWTTPTEADLADPRVSAGVFETDDTQAENVAGFLGSVCHPLYNASGGLVRPAKPAYLLMSKEAYRNVPALYYLKQQDPADVAGPNVRFVLNNDYVTTYNASTGTDGYGFYGPGDTVQGQLALVRTLLTAVPVETWTFAATSGAFNWSTRSNWTVGPVASPLTAAGAAATSPGQAYDAAAFTSAAAPAAVRVNLDVATARVLGVYFDNATSWTIAGPQALTLTAYGTVGADGRVPRVAGAIPAAVATDATAYAADAIPISVRGTGADTVTAAVTLDPTNAVGLVVDQQDTAAPFGLAGKLTTAGLPVTVQGPGATVISGAIAGGATRLTVAGPGRLTLAGAGTFTGGTVVAGGTLEVTAAGTVGTGGLTVTGGSVVLDAATAGGVLTRSLGAVTVAAGQAVTAAPAASATDRTLVRVTALTLAGQMDLGDGDLDVSDGSLAALTAAAAAGFAGGTWAGPAGLTSASAAADAGHLTAVGVAPAGVLGPTFDGQPVAPTDVLARYTYYGDANLDGTVDAADYLRVDAGYVQHLTGWANGDFNYDGVVDGSDYTLMDNAFDQQRGGVARPAVSTATAVPEPAWLGAAAAGVGLCGRRRRRPSAPRPGPDPGGPAARGRCRVNEPA